MPSEVIQKELDRQDSRAARLRYLASTNTPTQAEQLLLDRLEGFMFQQPLLDFIVDFFNPETAVCIEVDGAYHWKQFRKDRRRDLRLYEELGVYTLRIANETVIDDPDEAVEYIRSWRPTPPTELDERPVDPKTASLIRAKCDETVLRWEPRSRSDVLKDYDLLEKFSKWGFRGQEKFLERMKKKVLYWPTDGYPQKTSQIF